MIQIRDLRKTYFPNVQALRGINLDIAHGETTAVVGESGCGKSTLAKILMKVEEPTSGDVLIGGKSIRDFSRKELSRKIQMIFQDPSSSLNPRKKIIDLVEEPLHIRGDLSSKEIREKAQQTLMLVGIREENHSRYPHMFSGGQKQRVAIARALVCEPDLIICDEPVSALDVSVQAQVLNLLRQLQKEKNLSYLFISHDLSVVRFISHQVSVMYLGQIVEKSPRTEIFAQPLHPYTQMLLASTPRLGEVPQDMFLKTSELPSPSNPPSGCAFHTRCPYVRERCKIESPLLIPRPVWPAACHFAEEISEVKSIPLVEIP
ncbi:MAG: oligopeptide/dipeptide ABC transporter ATP-binding protein [Bdellovibrionota bacterium]